MSHFSKSASATMMAAFVLAAPLAQAQSGPMNFERNAFASAANFDACNENKDGMVTKAEFPSVVGKMWDARAKKMGASTTERLNKAQFDQVLMYLRAGG